MPIRLDSRDSDFARRFDDFLNAKREVSEDVDAAARAIVADVVARGDAALFEATQKFDRLELTAETVRIHRLRDRGGGQGLRPENAGRADACPRPDPGFPPQTAAEGRAPYRCARSRAWPPLDGDRGRRPVCAGRHRRLSVVGLDECGAGEGRGRAAGGDGGAGAGRQAQSAGAGRGAAGRRDRDLSRRRGAGGCGPCLWHGEHCAGGEDRRPRQCLCRRRKAHRFRQSRAST